MTSNPGQLDAMVRSRPTGEQIFTLKGAELLYRVMVETMTEGALTLAPDGVILYCNQSFAELIEGDLEQIIGSRVQRFFAPDAVIEFEGLLRQAEAARAKGRFNMLRSDGTSVPTYVAMHSSYAAMNRLSTNGPAGVVAIFTDLSGVERAETARDQIERIVENASDAILGEDLNGVVTSWNRGAERLYGYTAAEMVGRNIDVLATPERKGDIRTLIAKVRRGEEIGIYEFERVTKAGRSVTVALSLSPIRDAAGALVGISTVGHDITERKRAEVSAQAAAHYARSLIEASLDPMVTISAEGKITDVNEATARATGRSRDQLIGTDFADYFTDPYRARAGYRAAFAKGSVKDYPLSLRHSSGTVADVLYNATLFHDVEGKVAGVFAAARDITERKRAEDELRQNRQHLEEIVAARTAQLAAANSSLDVANKELETFAYSVSHDLRAPLRAVDGFSAILLEDYADKLDPEGQRVLGVIREGTVKMARMIDDILAFSRAGRAEMATAPMDMEAIARAALAELETDIAGRKVTFEVGALPQAHGDAGMLQRVWANLLGNAVKYTAPRPEARIEIGATSDRGETVYFVRDNGVGFDMKYVDKLFGVFQRLHGGDFAGTGIGLAIVKRIITRHGGRVWAEGKLDEGATFYFALPAKEKAGA